MFTCATVKNPGDKESVPGETVPYFLGKVIIVAEKEEV